MRLRPPNVKENWDDNDVWTQTLLISYSQIRDCEEAKMREALAKVGVASVFGG